MKRLMLVLSLIGMFGAAAGYAEDTKNQPAGANPQQVAPELEKQIKELIGQLGNDDWQAREKAQAELLKIGMPARGYLEETLKKTTDPEVKQRATQLLKQIPDTIAKDTVLKAIDNLAKAKGYHFTAEMAIDMGGEEGMGGSENIKMEGVHQNPNLTYIKAEVGAGDRPSDGGEAYRRNDKMVTKDNGSDHWRVERDMPPVPLFMFFPSEIDKMKVHVEKVSFGNDEKVGAIDCKVIELSFNPEGLKKIPGEVMPMGLEAGLKHSYKVWVDKKDNRIYKTTLSVEIDMGVLMGGHEGIPPDEPPQAIPTMKVTADMKFSDYDKDIDIKVPDEVTKLFEQPNEENNDEAIRAPMPVPLPPGVEEEEDE